MLIESKLGIYVTVGILVIIIGYLIRSTVLDVLDVQLKTEQEQNRHAEAQTQAAHEKEQERTRRAEIEAQAAREQFEQEQERKKQETERVLSVKPYGDLQQHAETGLAVTLPVQQNIADLKFERSKPIRKIISQRVKREHAPRAIKAALSGLPKEKVNAIVEAVVTSVEFNDKGTSNSYDRAEGSIAEWFISSTYRESDDTISLGMMYAGVEFELQQDTEFEEREETHIERIPKECNCRMETWDCNCRDINCGIFTRCEWKCDRCSKRVCDQCFDEVPKTTKTKIPKFKHARFTVDQFSDFVRSVKRAAFTEIKTLPAPAETATDPDGDQ
eukprot:TRINITY_DN67506_c7_g1_i11.p1 TRINITY_DN67506_c7_g1~~TRINITY_DN67506_c7_g1_i11.p1  ORF type:complete len:330 (+),score=19.16 TRINITY_DN67506_c7_g1_i11:87-1076(+)